MAYSALFNDLLEILDLLTHFLYLCSRNSATWQWHLTPLHNTEFWLELCHVWFGTIAAYAPYSSLSSKNTGKEGDCKSNSITIVSAPPPHPSSSFRQLTQSYILLIWRIFYRTTSRRLDLCLCERNILFGWHTVVMTWCDLFLRKFNTETNIFGSFMRFIKNMIV